MVQANGILSVAHKQVPEPEYQKIVTALAAATAEELDTDHVRILGLHRLADPKERSQIMAAISAALCSALGSRITGLRILSVRRIPD